MSTEISKSSLNKAQDENLTRFYKKIPKDAGKIKIMKLPNGGAAFQTDVPARNIPGSFARYEKQVDALGKTILYTKTTFAPDRGIVHVKTKFPRPVP